MCPALLVEEVLLPKNFVLARPINAVFAQHLLSSAIVQWAVEPTTTTKKSPSNR